MVLLKRVISVYSWIQPKNTPNKIYTSTYTDKKEDLLHWGF
jgi:hypothetical protein